MKHRNRIAYALGDFGINLYFMSTLSFLLFFYTEVFGLSAGVAAGVFLVARLVDAITDPIMGYIADRTRSRFGRFRPYLLYGAIPLGLITVATFTVPELSMTGKIIWAYTTYVLFGILYTVVTIPYASLTAVISDDSQERSTISTLRMAGAFSGGWLVSVSMLWIVDFFGGGAGGFQNTLIVFSVVSTVMLWITFFGTREQVTVHTETDSLPLRDAANSLIKNPPLWIVIALFVLGMLAFTFRATATPYYFTYNMERPDLIGLFFGITLGVMILGLIAIPYLSEKLGKAGAVRVGSVIAMIGALGFYFNDPSNVFMVFFWGSLLALGGAPIAVLGWAMIPDTVEYAEWRSRVRADGVIFSTASFFQKVGKAVGGAAVAALLGLFGYVANQEQTDSALMGILIAMAVVPLLANVLLFVVSLFYRLTAPRHAALVKRIRSRTSGILSERTF